MWQGLVVVEMLGAAQILLQMGQSRVEQPKGCPKWGSSGLDSINAAPKGGRKMQRNYLFE